MGTSSGYFGGDLHEITAEGFIKFNVSCAVLVGAAVYVTGATAWDKIGIHTLVVDANGNTSNAAGSNWFVANADGTGTAVFSPRHWNVSAGDVLKLMVSNGTGARGRVEASARSYMFIMLI